jgi:hypothetical protein
MAQVPPIPEADARHCSRVLKPPAAMPTGVLKEYSMLLPAWAAGIAVMASVNNTAVDAATVVKSCFIFLFSFCFCFAFQSRLLNGEGERI